MAFTRLDQAGNMIDGFTKYRLDDGQTEIADDDPRVAVFLDARARQLALLDCLLDCKTLVLSDDFKDLDKPTQDAIKKVINDSAKACKNKVLRALGV